MQEAKEAKQVLFEKKHCSYELQSFVAMTRVRSLLEELRQCILILFIIYNVSII
jgi:hypothetical protein